MKVLTVYSPLGGATDENGNEIKTSESSDIVLGGIEKFIQLLSVNIPNIIVVNTSGMKNSTSAVEDAIVQHNPDVIILHDPFKARPAMKFDIPTIVIMHSGLYRDIKIMEYGKRIQEILDAGMHVYFVSKNQHEFHLSHCERVNGWRFGDIHGYISPGYADTSWKPSEDLVYDVVTVGRASADKDPFYVHRKLHGTNLHSLVMTNDGKFKSASSNKYVTDNHKWSYPQETLRLLPHDKVIDNIAKSGVYVSTCPHESWGISALESLCNGCPLILLKVPSLPNHSSSEIAFSSDHYREIARNCRKDDFLNLCKETMKMPYHIRLEMSELTKEKHSQANWKTNLDRMINRSYDSKKNSGLLKFV